MLFHVLIPDENMIVYGKHSPIGLSCSDGKLTLQDFGVTRKDIELLEFFFMDFHYTNYTKDEVERLNKLDEYLDIPHIQAVFDPSPSFASFHRLVENDVRILSKYWHHPDLVAESIIHGSVKTFQRAWEMHPLPRGLVLRTIVQYNQVKLIKSLSPLSAEEIFDISYRALNHGSANMLQYIHGLGWWPDRFFVEWMGNFNVLDCLRYIHAIWPNEVPFPWEVIMKEYAKRGYVECLAYIYFQHHIHIDSSTGFQHHSTGSQHHLDTSTGFQVPWSHDLCDIAAEHGQLAALMYLHDHGAKWGVNTCSNAALFGHYTCLTYLHEHGCPWDRSTLVAATQAGKLDCLKYAVENKLPTSQGLCNIAASNGHLRCLKYLHGQGCVIDKETYNAAYGRHNNQVMKYILQQLPQLSQT